LRRQCQLSPLFEEDDEVFLIFGLQFVDPVSLPCFLDSFEHFALVVLDFGHPFDSIGDGLVKACEKRIVSSSEIDRPEVIFGGSRKAGSHLGSRFRHFLRFHQAETL
jgi:hypothetical protein